MILLSATIDSFMVRELQRLGVPVLLAVRSMDDSKVDIVEPDNIFGGAEIMRHLYELGHRRIGLVMGPENSSTSRDRAKGALSYLREKGVPAENTPVMWNTFSYESGYSCASQMLSLQNRVTAIMAGGDSIALGVLDAARTKNIDVPSQLSVVGFDNIPLSGSRLIGLTTIDSSAKEMARVVCRRMLDRIRNGVLTPATRDVMPVHLIRRDTTAPPWKN
jgi:LacI family transcriptional regulator